MEGRDEVRQEAGEVKLARHARRVAAEVTVLIAEEMAKLGLGLGGGRGPERGDPSALFVEGARSRRHGGDGSASQENPHLCPHHALS